MDAKRFEELIQATRLGQKQKNTDGGRGVLGLRYHLVDGDSISDAADKAGVDRQSIYQAKKRLPLERCKCCKQFLPKDQPTVKGKGRK